MSNRARNIISLTPQYGIETQTGIITLGIHYSALDKLYVYAQPHTLYVVVHNYNLILDSNRARKSYTTIWNRHYTGTITLGIH